MITTQGVKNKLFLQRVTSTIRNKQEKENLKPLIRG